MMTNAELAALYSIRTNLPEITGQLKLKNQIEMCKLGLEKPELGIDTDKLLAQIKKSMSN